MTGRPWNGEHYRYPKLNVYPKPHQKPHPPIYVTANRDPESFQMIGRRGHTILAFPNVRSDNILPAGMSAHAK